MNSLKRVLAASMVLLAGCSSSGNHSAIPVSINRGQPTVPVVPATPPLSGQPFTNPALMDSVTPNERTSYDRRSQEDKDMERARQESLRTFEEEEKRRNTVPVALTENSARQVQWGPSEGNLLTAGEHVLQLRRNKGGVRPTQTEMVECLKNKMNLSSVQAQMIIEELGF